MKSILRGMATASIFVFAASTANFAQAGTILQPASVVAPSENGSALAVNMINQTGLSAAYTSQVTDFTTYTAATTHGNSGATVWANVPAVTFPQVLDFSLGGSFNIQSIAAWNWYRSDLRGLQNFDLFAANNAAFVGAVALGSFVAAQEGANNVLAQVFSFGPVNASHVRMTINSNYGSTSQVVVSEVAFEISTVSVPEPGTLALFGLGLVGLGFARRKRMI